MTKNKAIKIVTDAIEKYLFGMGEQFSIEYVAQCDTAIKVLKKAVDYNEKTE